MRFAAEKFLIVAVLAFGGVAVHASRSGLLLAQTSECNSDGTGDRCGTITKCTSWRLTSGEISTTGGGVGATCETQVEIYLFKVPYCPMCHYPIGGGSGGGGGSGSGGGGGSTPNPCGDPDMWSDDSSGCDQETQQAT